MAKVSDVPALREDVRRRAEQAEAAGCDTQYAELRRWLTNALAAYTTKGAAIEAAETALAVLSTHGVAAVDFLAATNVDVDTLLLSAGL